MSEHDEDKLDGEIDAEALTDSEPAEAETPEAVESTSDEAPAEVAEVEEDAADEVEPTSEETPAEDADDAEAETISDEAPADGAAPEEAAAEAPPLEPVDVAAVEAILFTTDSPLSPAKVADVAGLLGGRRAAKEAVEILNTQYASTGRSFRIESRAGGYRMLTLPEYNDVLARLLKVRSESKLSQAALETLAIIAYRQPILRADIEAIRGVSSGEMVRGLMEKGLVKIVGRAEEIGRPMLYGTTQLFLELFGLNSLKDLPEAGELAMAAGRPAPPAKKEEAPAEEPADAPTDTGAEAAGDEAEAETSEVVEDAAEETVEEAVVAEAVEVEPDENRSAEESDGDEAAAAVE